MDLRRERSDADPCARNYVFNFNTRNAIASGKYIRGYICVLLEMQKVKISPQIYSKCGKTDCNLSVRVSTYDF